MKRSLSLRREMLVELTPADLGSVAGGGLVSGLTCPVLDCLTVLSGGICQLTAQPRCWAP